MEASTTRLRAFAIALFVLLVVATVVAVVVNWPAQFGGVGTDAREEFLSRGTAISPPPLPLLLILAVAVLARGAGRLVWVAVVAAYVASVLILIGGLGELFAEGTVDTPKSVLVISGIVSVVLAAAFAWLATRVALERRQAAVASAGVE